MGKRAGNILDYLINQYLDALFYNKKCPAGLVDWYAEAVAFYADLHGYTESYHEPCAADLALPVPF